MESPEALHRQFGTSRLAWATALTRLAREVHTPAAAAVERQTGRRCRGERQYCERRREPLLRHFLHLPSLSRCACGSSVGGGGHGGLRRRQRVANASAFSCRRRYERHVFASSERALNCAPCPLCS